MYRFFAHRDPSGVVNLSRTPHRYNRHSDSRDLGPMVSAISTLKKKKKNS